MQTIYALFLCAVSNGQILSDHCMVMIGTSEYASVAACEVVKAQWVRQLPVGTVKHTDGHLVSWQLPYANSYPVTPICMKKSVPTWEPVH